MATVLSRGLRLRRGDAAVALVIATYAPEGRRIAFIGYADTRLSTAELVVLDLAAAKGAGAEAVTAAADTGAEAEWSPDGKDPRVLERPPLPRRPARR